MGLKFDMEGLTNEILNKLEVQLQFAFIAWEKEALSRTNNKFYKNFSKADVEYEIKRQTKGIITYLKANTYMLASSYGTGSLMLSDNPGLRDYMKSNRWNPLRRGKDILGRAKGTYTNAFGEKRNTSGAFAGVRIEGKRVFKGKRLPQDPVTSEDYYIYPSPPSYAIQDAEKFLYKTYLPSAYKIAIQNINFSKYLIES